MHAATNLCLKIWKWVSYELGIVKISKFAGVDRPSSVHGRDDGWERGEIECEKGFSPATEMEARSCPVTGDGG